jgi:hypothetical protein
MTNYTNPAPAGDGPKHLAPGETVTSDSPKVTLGPAKAIVAAVGGVVTSLSVWLTTGPFNDGALDLNEGIALVIAILAGLGVPGIGTYVTRTKVTAN